MGEGEKRLPTRDVLESIIHAIHIHRDSCYWLIEKKHLLQLNKLLLKRNSNQFHVVGGEDEKRAQRRLVIIKIQIGGGYL